MTRPVAVLPVDTFMKRVSAADPREADDTLLINHADFDRRRLDSESDVRRLQGILQFRKRLRLDHALSRKPLPNHLEHFRAPAFAAGYQR